MRLVNVHDLKHSLDCLCSYLDKLYSINSGGCCYIAYLIACHLDKLKVKYDLVIYDYKRKDEACINSEVQNMCLPNSVTGKQTCEHYCISISGGGVVNKGDVTGLKKYIVKGITNKNLKWLYKNGYWNRMYNRDNNKCVKGMINSFFSKYEKNNLSNH